MGTQGRQLVLVSPNICDRPMYSLFLNEINDDANPIGGNLADGYHIKQFSSSMTCTINNPGLHPLNVTVYACCMKKDVFLQDPTATSNPVWDSGNSFSDNMFNFLERCSQDITTSVDGISDYQAPIFVGDSKQYVKIKGSQSFILGPGANYTFMVKDKKPKTISYSTHVEAPSAGSEHFSAQYFAYRSQFVVWKVNGIVSAVANSGLATDITTMQPAIQVLYKRTLSFGFLQPHKKYYELVTATQLPTTLAINNPGQDAMVAEDEN